MPLTKNHVFEALNASKITWLQNCGCYRFGLKEV